MKVPPPVNSAIILGGSAQQRHMAFTASWSWSMFLRTGSLAHLGTESEEDHLDATHFKVIQWSVPRKVTEPRWNSLTQFDMSQRTQKSINIALKGAMRQTYSKFLATKSITQCSPSRIFWYLMCLYHLSISFIYISTSFNWQDRMNSEFQSARVYREPVPSGWPFVCQKLLSWHPEAACSLPWLAWRSGIISWLAPRIEIKDPSNQAQRGNTNSMELGLCATPVPIATAKPQFCQGFVHAGQGSIYDGNQGISHACGWQPTNRCQTRNIEPRAIELRWGWNIW